jgi:hypothetical protein
MALAVKPMDRIKRKWVSATQANQGEYEEGIKNPRKDWATETANAEKNYNSGIQASIAQGRFGKGVRKAGTSKWQEKALSKGPGRWASGVALSADDYEKGFAPYRQVLESLSLPDRGPKGDPKNINRVAAVAKALHDKKVSGA